MKSQAFAQRTSIYAGSLSLFQKLFRTVLTLEILPLLASPWLITGISDTAQHDSPCLPSYFGTPFHFLPKAELFALSLTAQHKPIFCEHLNTLTLARNSCNFSPPCADFTSRCSTACCLTSYTPPEIKAGES